jgi:hypothetical protein
LHESIGLWFLVFIVFVLLALGPSLHIAGHEIHFPLMPYTVVVKLIPGMSLGGMPVRMVSIAILAASIIAAVGFAELLNRKRSSAVFVAIFLIVMVFEYLPGPIPARENPLPEFVKQLKNLPAGAVYDARDTKFHALYYQTVHQKPMAYGYIARVTGSVDAKSQELRRAFEMGDYERLSHEYGFRYLVLPGNMDRVAALGSPLFQDGDAQIYDLSNVK